MARAERRFTWFLRAVRDSAPEGTGWRRPTRDLYTWLREASRHLREARKAIDDFSRGGHIEALEGILDKLTKAHDWTRRFPSLVKKLKATKTLWAFERLVRLGCVPDALAYCIQEQERAPSESELQRRRDTLQRRELKALAREFERLADRCDDYFSRTDRAQIDSIVDLYAAIWLRNEAARFQAEAARLIPGKRRHTTRAEAVLLQTMIEIRTVTGKYHEAFLAEILRHTPTHKKTTDESLRKWRAREIRIWRERGPAHLSPGPIYPRLVGTAPRPQKNKH